MKQLLKLITPFTLLVIVLSACEKDYSDMKLVLTGQIHIIEATIHGIMNSNSPEKTVFELRQFNEKMSKSYGEYIEAKKKHPELEHLFNSPPSSLSKEITRIKSLSSNFRDILIMTASHTGEPGMRRHLESTVVILDRLKSQ